MVAAMDAVSVDGAVLVSPFSMYRYDASYALEVYAAHPNRFRLVKPVDPTDAAVVDAIGDWAGTKGTVGIRVFLRDNVSTDPADAGINRVLATAAQHPNNCGAAEVFRVDLQQSRVVEHRQDDGASGLRGAVGTTRVRPTRRLQSQVLGTPFDAILIGFQRELLEPLRQLPRPIALVAPEGQPCLLGTPVNHGIAPAGSQVRTRLGAGAKGIRTQGPRKIDDSFETALFACSAGKTDSVPRGTAGSNPLCSRGESSTNLKAKSPPRPWR